MKTKAITRVIIIVILGVLLLQPVVPVQAAPLRNGSVSDVIPFLGLISSWFTRNRTYRSAEQFIRERRNEYKLKLSKLDVQLSEGTIFSGGSSPESQQAAYVRVKALLIQERDTAMNFAELIKKGARRDFNKAAREEITKVVMSTNFAGRILKVLDQGFSQAIRFVNDAVTDIERIRNTAQQIQTIGALIGGALGEDLRNTVGSIIEKIDAQAGLTEADLEAVKKDLANVQKQIKDYQKMGYFPEASQVGSDLIWQLVGMGPGSAQTEAILNILGFRSGQSKEKIRAGALQLLAAGQKTRCREIVSKLLAALQALESGDTSEPIDPKKICNELNAHAIKTGGDTAELESPPEEPAAELVNTNESESVTVVGDWHGVACDEAEGTYSYRWSIDLIQDPNTNQIVGTVKFHACPGGGRVLYRVTGEATTNPIVTLNGIRKEGAGDLFNNSPETAVFEYDTQSNQISPNYAP